jgi:hypothetical protein
VQVTRSHYRRNFAFLISTICALVALFAFVGNAGAVTRTGGTGTDPWIASELPDYPPGATVNLMGGSWQPSESVHIRINDDAGQTWSRDVDVTADSNGDIADSFNLPDWFVANYSVTATGTTSGTAVTTFTDANVTSATVSVRTTTNGTSCTSILATTFNAGAKACARSTITGVTGGGGSTGDIFVLWINPSGSQVGSSIQHTGANGASFDDTLTVNDVGVWTVKICTNGSCPASAVLASQTFSVSGCTVPAVTAQPSDQSITYGANATFTATASGTSPSVQWQVSTNGGSTFNNLSGETSGTLTLTKPPVSSNGNQYRAVFTNGCGTATSNSATLSVAPKNLTISGATANNKTYDGNATATVNFGSATLAGVESGDTVTINSAGYSASFADKNAGTSKAVSVSGVTLGGTSAANYTVSQPSGLTASIDKRNVTASITAADKTYDGSDAATITGCSLEAASGNHGVLSGETVGCSGSNGHFADKNAGSNKAVSADVALSGADKGNYQLTSPSAATTANIDRARLDIYAASDSKTYDGGTSSSGTPTLSAGQVQTGDSVDGLTQAFQSKNVMGAGNSTLVVTGYSIHDGNSGGNYDVHTHTASGTISARGLTVTAAGINKTYDGTANASVSLATNAVSGDAVVANYATASFSNKNVGTAKPVSVSGITISGGDAGNYNLLNTTASTTANISAKSVVGNFTAANKVWDGTTSAVVLSRSLAVPFAGDDVSLTGGTANFSDASVGIGKTVTLTGATLTGADAGNYNLNAVNTAVASITAWNAQGYGFYSPVAAGSSTFTAAPLLAPTTNPGDYWNIAKGGSTVPLKFNVYAGTVEKTSLSDISGFQTFKLNACSGGLGEDPVDFTTTGNTSLRYDTSAMQWIQNWKTPSVSSDTCYRTMVTFADGSSLEAFFKLKK